MYKPGDTVLILNSTGFFKAGDTGNVISVDLVGQWAVVGTTFQGLSASCRVDFKDMAHAFDEDALQLSTYYLGDYPAAYGPSAEQVRQWKEAGCCQQCGYKLPMSVWGLGECPFHPKPLERQ